MLTEIKGIISCEPPGDFKGQDALKKADPAKQHMGQKGVYKIQRVGSGWGGGQGTGSLDQQISRNPWFKESRGILWNRQVKMMTQKSAGTFQVSYSSKWQYLVSPSLKVPQCHNQLLAVNSKTVFETTIFPLVTWRTAVHFNHLSGFLFCFPQKWW